MNIEVPRNGVRVQLLDRWGRPRKVAKIRLGNGDGSIYIITFRQEGRVASIGKSPFPVVESTTFDTRGSAQGDEDPRMSLHPSGLAKVHLGSASEQMKGLPWWGHSGHIASIEVFNIESLTLNNSRSSDPMPVVVTSPAQAGMTSTRVVVRVLATDTEALAEPVVIRFHPASKPPLRVDLRLHGRFEPHNDGHGVIVHGGWGPAIGPTAVSGLLFTTTTGGQATPEEVG